MLFSDLKRLYFREKRTIRYKARKKFLRTKKPKNFPASKGIETLQNRTLMFNGCFFFLQHFIKKGYKYRQFLIIVSFLAILKLITKRDLNIIFSDLFRKITPLLKFLPKTFGRTVYKIPVKNLAPYNLHKAVGKLFKYSDYRSEETFAMRLAAEVCQSLKLTSATIKWKQELHAEAFANRANLIYLKYY